MIVKTDFPISKVLRKPKLAGRMITWSVELSEFEIKYEPRGPIKSQGLVDFIFRVTNGWTLYVDESSNRMGSGAGIFLEGPGHVRIEQSLHFGFKASNNQVESKALVFDLLWPKIWEHKGEMSK